MQQSVAALANGTIPAARKSLPKVRLAVKEDLNEILSLGRDLHYENGLMSLSDEAITKVAIDAINGTSGIIGVIGAPGHIEGLILLQLRQFWYSDTTHLEELKKLKSEEKRPPIQEERGEQENGSV